MDSNSLQEQNQRFVQDELRRSVDMNRINEVVATLPQPYAEIDTRFLETHAEQIAEIKRLLDHRGGLHLVGPSEDMLVLVRVPGREHLREWEKVRKADKSGDGVVKDMRLVELALLYPSPDVVKGWIDQAPGVITMIAYALLEISKLVGEPIVKKL